MPKPQTFYVKSASEFPSWKSPCPICGAKYPQPSISARKDGTAAWCKGCGTNWKLNTIQTPEGWAQTGKSLGAKPHAEEGDNDLIIEAHAKLDKIINILSREMPDEQEF